MKLAQTVVTVTLAPFLSVGGQNVVLTNDDGWAVAMIRQQYTALNNAGYKVYFYSLDSHLLSYLLF
jgi:5'-nucleotidase